MATGTGKTLLCAALIRRFLKTRNAERVLFIVDPIELAKQTMEEFNHVIIVDLTGDPRWPEVLRTAGIESAPELKALVQAHVFAYRRQRDDHHSEKPPDDIVGASPK
jgi:superfamily II DNA or RNA helicase